MKRNFIWRGRIINKKNGRKIILVGARDLGENRSLREGKGEGTTLREAEKIEADEIRESRIELPRPSTDCDALVYNLTILTGQRGGERSR